MNKLNIKFSEEAIMRDNIDIAYMTGFVSGMSMLFTIGATVLGCVIHMTDDIPTSCDIYIQGTIMYPELLDKIAIDCELSYTIDTNIDYLDCDKSILSEAIEKYKDDCSCLIHRRESAISQVNNTYIKLI